MREAPRTSMILIGLCTVFSLFGCTRQSKWDAYVERRMQEDPVFFSRFLEEEAIRESQRTEVLPVSITCIDHGDYRASSFSVQEVAYGQISRGMVGGAFNCGGVLGLGYPVPLTWRPGLNVKVRWNTYVPGAAEPTRHEKETTIAPYARAGAVYVHFFPGDQVRVVVSNFWPEGKNHPTPRDSVVPPPEIE